MLPFSATSTTTLNHDVIMSSNIIADAQSITPLAMIHNPAANGIAGNKQEEALVITRQEVNNAPLVQLCHVARCSSSESGWSLTPLFTNIHPVEVTPGANRVGTSYERIYSFFLQMPVTIAR